ncbi:M67 family metallopeptidase [Rossellomorea sp. DA94]|uniref:Mov34/MPN/PAD-1 family protein n=1 Tax=Rossellomorea sp. DA94 TaxID=3038653 RepID=UPI001CC97FE6|nr:M67 family metallopeptidase [Rossellomorea sp. DA94]MCA0148551.1 M67 family metallopeptidase [Rossellomorea vietnamensis]WGG47970.1 M67 family metallopeptidase [Rossellomorea sp. DA94]
MLSRRVYTRIMLEVKKDLPNESCGLISGLENRCLTVWPMQNMEATPYSFAINPDEQELIISRMLGRNESFKGIYHSHPFGRPVPSKDDVAYSIYPDVYYFIASVGGREEELRCYKINNGKVKHIEILIK